MSALISRPRQHLARFFEITAVRSTTTFDSAVNSAGLGESHWPCRFPSLADLRSVVSAFANDRAIAAAHLGLIATSELELRDCVPGQKAVG